ncbi:MmpS family transport accessory protein [Micromonospora rubida]
MPGSGPAWSSPAPLAPPQPWAAPEPWAPPATSSGPGSPAVPTATPTSPATPHPATPHPAGQPWPGYGPAGWPPGHPGQPGQPTWPGHPGGPGPVGQGGWPGQGGQGGWPGQGGQGGWPPAGYPPPFAYPGQPAVRSDGSTKVIGLVIGLVVALVIGLCGCVCLAGVLTSPDDRTSATDPWYGDPSAPDEDGEAVEASPDPEPTRSPAIRPSNGAGRVTVVYEVTGQGPVYLQYYDASGDLIQTENVKLPWRKSFRMADASRVMVLASSNDSPYGVNCRITVDGRTVARDDSGYWVNCTG